MRTDGSIKWDGGMVFVGEAFAGETVGLQACDEGLWHVQLGPLRLGILHERSRTIVPTAGGTKDFAAFIKGEVETNTALLVESGFKPE